MTKEVVSEQEQQRYRLTLEALAEVDAGRTVDHDDFERWVGLSSDTCLSRRPLGKGDRA